jgi:hypothetical protein
MGGWIFLIVVSTFIVAPIYWFVMRQLSGAEKVSVFLGVAVLTSTVCFMLLKQDPRGVAGPGYLVIFLFGPLAIGWICCGFLGLLAGTLHRMITRHVNDRDAHDA